MSPTDAPRHVLMTADTVGGVWTYVVELSRQLTHRGINVTLAVMGPSPSLSQRAEVAQLEGITVHAHPFALEWMHEPWADVEAAGQWLIDLEWLLQPDVVHLNGYCHAALPWQAPAFVTGHSCVLSWWRHVHGTPAPAAWDRYAAEVRRGVAAAAAVVAPSAAMLQALDELYGLLRSGRVILNGRSPAMKTVQKDPLILASGRLWDEAKNVAALCEVAPDLTWPLAIAGATDDASCGIRSRPVHYLGRLPGDELRRWMGRASIYALPARYEPFGLSVLEAALAGCALVLGDIPSLREIWGNTAVYVDPDDRSGLRACLIDLIHNDGRREALAQAARRRASELTPRRMADQYCALYAELMRECRSVLPLGAV